MKQREREELSELVVNSHTQQADYSLKVSVSQVVELGFSRRMVYRVLKKYYEHGTTDFFSKSGWTIKISRQKLKVLSKSVNNTTGINQPEMARRLDVSQFTVSRTYTLLTPSCSDRTWPALITLAKCKHSSLPIESIMWHVKETRQTHHRRDQLRQFGHYPSKTFKRTCGRLEILIS